VMRMCFLLFRRMKTGQDRVFANVHI